MSEKTNFKLSGYPKKVWLVGWLGFMAYQPL